jgi:hypothetical protein
MLGAGVPDMTRKALFVMACILLLAGCDRLTRSCTTIGCGAPFDVRFVRPTWPAGQYRVEVTADGRTGACQVSLPFASCQVAVPCEGAKAWFLGLSGCALPTADHSLSGVTFNDSRPAQVTVTVSQDGRQLASQTFQPAYTDSWPNGKDCDEVPCRTAPSPSMQLP